VSSKLDTVMQILREIYSRKGFGHVGSQQVVKVVDTIVIVYGKLGEYWKQKKGNMLLHGVVLVEHWTPIINVPAFTAWALMEEQIGNVKDARMIFERALRKFSPGSHDRMALYRSYELMEQRLGDSAAAKNIYQRSLRESFDAKDEIDLIKHIDDENDEISRTATSSTTEKDKDDPKNNKKDYEVEVVRWENTGGEVWLNDRAIEAKVSIKKPARNNYGANKNMKSKLNP
jgi:hypothetical protein